VAPPAAVVVVIVAVIVVVIVDVVGPTPCPLITQGDW
jgi:hypothetical protein